MQAPVRSRVDPGISSPGFSVDTLTRAKPSKSYRLTTSFLALSLLLSLAFVAVRNTYDDEYSNLRYVDLPIAQIIHKANSEDVHPPGMYLLSHLAYELAPSPRWMTLFDLAFLYTGLATFLFAITPLLPTAGSRLCFLLLASLHPQLLMWGNTIRWYGWWTGLALVSLVVALRPSAGERPSLSYGRAVTIGLLLTGLFYLNYITLVFGLALAACMLFRYGWRASKQYLLVLVVFVPLVLPQVRPFVKVHIPGGGGQRAGILTSLSRLVQGLLSSEAYLPWHPLALLSLLLFAAILVYGAVRSYGRVRVLGLSQLPAALLPAERGLAAIALFSLLFFCMVVAAGFGLKPRNGLLLIPVLAVPCALLVGSASARVQALALAALALWSGVGVAHLLRREGLAKSNMNNRPEELATYIRNNEGAACSVVVTYDSLMSLTISASHLPRTLVLSAERSAVPLHEPPFALSQCPSVDLYRVQSYLGGLGAWGRTVSAEMLSAQVASTQPAQILHLSFDPDASVKRKLTFMSGAADLPDYRYVVKRESITPQEFEQVERELPHYDPSDGQPRPTLRFKSFNPWHKPGNHTHQSNEG